ncbi:hypothetical protein J2S21_001804 [Peribacillus cavernae]|nr:hypothetical protein [Peribacillus cavernae]
MSIERGTGIKQNIKDFFGNLLPLPLELAL